MPHRPLSHPVPQFFVLVFLLSAPFWVLGALADGQLLPGLPVSAFMVVCPVLIGAFMVSREGGTGAVWRFLAQAADARNMRGWAWIAALGIMPGVMFLSAALQMAAGTELPPMEVDPVQALTLFAVFFVAATAEELGWTGFATHRLLATRTVLATGLIVGAIAVLWHILPLLQADRAWSWIAWWAVGTTARRIIIVWLFARGGQSVLGASLFHTMSNLTWMMIPVMGSHYDPASTALVLVAFAAAVLLFDAVAPKDRASQA